MSVGRFRVDAAAVRVEDAPDTLGGKRFTLQIQMPSGETVERAIACGRRPPAPGFGTLLAQWLERGLNSGQMRLQTLPEHLVMPLMLRIMQEAEEAAEAGQGEDAGGMAE